MHGAHDEQSAKSGQNSMRWCSPQHIVMYSTDKARENDTCPTGPILRSEAKDTNWKRLALAVLYPLAWQNNPDGAGTA